MVKHVEIGIAGRALGSDSLAWVDRLASRFGIKGTVFTKPDGSIKVTADGEEFILQEFANKLEKGRIFSTIENFYVKWGEPNERNFYILSGF